MTRSKGRGHGCTRTLTCIDVSEKSPNEVGQIIITNNHFITTGDAIVIESPTTVTDWRVGNNLTQTVAAATSAGYVIGNLYAPDSADDPTVGAGANLSSIFTTDYDGTTRSAWDIGAHEWAGTAAPRLPLFLRLQASANANGPWLEWTNFALAAVPLSSKTWFTRGNLILGHPK